MPLKTSGSSRRLFLQGAASSALALPLTGLFGRRAEALTQLEPIASPYGPLVPVPDQATGLHLLQLPEGFTYQSFGWSGDLMSDDRPNPTNHDGMAVVRSRLVDGRHELTLLRNHEATVNPLYGTIEAKGFYDRSTALVDKDANDQEFVGPAAGGVTKLIFTDGRFTSVEPALGGTWQNCAGGPTPWGTWLSCEENAADFSEVGGQPHGYVFEVSGETGETSGVPLKAMGRMRHEAVAFDPIGGAAYLTEDDRNQAGFYKFVPKEARQRVGALEQGGTLYMAKVVGTEKADLLNPARGDQHQIEWVRIEDPDLSRQPFSEPPFSPKNRASGPFAQGRNRGALRMSRLEGIFYSAFDRLIYLVDTSSGTNPNRRSKDFGTEGQGNGSVWTFDPAIDRLTCIFQSENPQAGNNFDNITVSPRGGVLLCEDGGGVEDAFGKGERLMGLAPTGDTYFFAKNNVQLTAADIQQAGKSAEFIKPGDHRDEEWAGVTFDPSGRWLFVNLLTPGITFAITGPWERGFL